MHVHCFGVALCAQVCAKGFSYVCHGDFVSFLVCTELLAQLIGHTLL